MKYNLRKKFENIANRLRREYPAELPITRYVAEIANAVKNHQAVIVCGMTGSGKTTQLPKILLDAGRGITGRIGCTQPRRLAAVAMARRLASEMNAQYGVEVGCKVRFDDHTSAETLVKFMTDGILLAETGHDRNLRQYDTIIIDEAHERSLNIDFILGYLKKLLEQRSDLKVIISSATIDAEIFSQFFNDAPIIQVEGRGYPIVDHFMPVLDDEELPAQVWRAVKWVSDLDRHGDILVFLPGEREIRDVADALNGRMIPYTDILPLFGRLGLDEQQHIFNPGRNRRIILSTNVAETSITIPRIQYVIDSGMVRMSRWNARSQIQELQIEQVSQAGAKQRRGRCGRLRDGVCVFLYSEEVLIGSPEYTDPEICRTSLAGVILQMAMLNLPSIERFPFINPPGSSLIREGYRALTDIGAINKKRQLTPVGRRLYNFRTDPHLAKMICHAERYKVSAEIMVIAAYLSIQDPRERPLEQQQAADQAHRQWRDQDSDFIAIIKLWNMLQQEKSSNSSMHRWCRRNFLNYKRVREWLNLYLDLWESASGIDFIQDSAVPQQVFENYNSDLIHKAILSGIPSTIGLWDTEQRYYRGTNGRKFYIFPGSGLHKRKQPATWIMACSLVETSRVFARNTAVIKPEWLEEVAPQLCRKHYEQIRWNRKTGFVQVLEKITSGGLIINPGRRIHYGRINSQAARQIFIHDGLAPGELETANPQVKRHLAMLQRIRKLEEKIRRPDALLDVEGIAEFLEKHIPPNICSTRDLEKWLENGAILPEMDIHDAMFEQFQPLNPDDYPDEMIFHGCRFKVVYHFAPGENDDGMILHASQAMINLLPDWVLEWLIPGYLPEKVELMIRSLAKDLRIECNPINETASTFCQMVRDQVISTEQPLVEALAAFLSQHCGITIHANDFNLDKLPRFLKMRLAILNADGKIVSYHDEIPGTSTRGSRVSAAVSGAASWLSVRSETWPDGDFPDSVTLEQSGRVAYPALTDGGNDVERNLFFDPREAEYEHRRGLIRLFRITEKSFLKFFVRHSKFPERIRLQLYNYGRKSNFADEFYDAVIHAALTDNEKLKIRNSALFDERCQIAREQLAAFAERKIATLEEFIAQAERITALLQKVGTNGRDSCDDIELELQFFFQPGIMNTPQFWLNTGRYLRTLQLRTERLLASPQKDLDKLESVLDFQNPLDEALEDGKSFLRDFDLYEFWLMLQEFRIMQFAPELKNSLRVSPEALSDCWAKIRR
ncbi:MAG: ATP-dependent RNA helicase HrpA [Victivallaceae bacterium]|nr:ATP-dependent RNA helicase HrpA [Victivallaceae bacterium]